MKKFDPVEAAKREAGGQPLPPLETAIPPHISHPPTGAAQAAPAPAKPPEPVSPPAPAKAPAPHAAQPAPKGPPPPPAKKYKVVKGGKLSLGGGQITQMKVGKILDPRFFGGAAGIERIKKAGIQLEELG